MIVDSSLVKNRFNYMLILIFLNWNCQQVSEQSIKQAVETNTDQTTEQIQFSQHNADNYRIKTPDGFNRIQVDGNSFAAYLRNLKLKPEGSLVNYFDGSTKPNYEVYEAVIDMKIGNKDLHQCADAVMRLRAEYLWNNKKYDQIHFNFTNGHKVEYKEWISGKRMNVKGNETWWTQKAEPSNTYDDFWSYMELIFMYAGTASLEKELQAIPITEAKIGDVLIQGGHPGHAVIIIDQATNDTTGESIYLLAQSYMPAQEIQILKNRINSKISPWYKLQEGDIITPEWTFGSNNLRRFRE